MSARCVGTDRSSSGGMRLFLCGFMVIASRPCTQVIALFAEGPTKIQNVYNWRVKETERMK